MRAQSTTFWLVTSLHLSGAVGQQEKIASGCSRSAVLAAAHGHLQVPHHLEGLVVKAPVTTGFSP